MVIKPVSPHIDLFPGSDEIPDAGEQDPQAQHQRHCRLSRQLVHQNQHAQHKGTGSVDQDPALRFIFAAVTAIGKALDHASHCEHQSHDESHGHKGQSPVGYQVDARYAEQGAHHNRNNSHGKSSFSVSLLYFVRSVKSRQAIFPSQKNHIAVRSRLW